jgi:hypothetical protein
METLTLEEKTSWVESSPTKLFDIDPATQQVSLFSSTSSELLPMISCTDQWSSSFCSCAYDQWTSGSLFAAAYYPLIEHMSYRSTKLFHSTTTMLCNLHGLIR